MRSSLDLTLLAALLVAANGYDLTVQLKSIDLTGYLQDGRTRCSQLYAFGVECYPLVAICIERITPETNDAKTCLTSPWIELGTWPNQNSITFKTPDRNGGWYNPQKLNIPGYFQGFYVKLRVQHYYGTTVSLIDNRLWTVDKFTDNGKGLTDSDLNGGQITSFKFSWTYNGALDTTVAPPVTVTPGPTQPIGSTTTGAGKATESTVSAASEATNPSTPLVSASTVTNDQTDASTSDQGSAGSSTNQPSTTGEPSSSSSAEPGPEEHPIDFRD